MSTQIATFESGHNDTIHDAQFDYYGRYLATCASDNLIKIWEIDENSQKLLTELKGHKGPVWQVAWAHPKFGTLLASCSYDRKVVIWKETSPNNWKVNYEFKELQQSVNSISWAPKEAGLVLACGSSDGKITVLNFEGNNWNNTTIDAHRFGVNAVSWAPYNPSDENPKIVSGGVDNKVKIWEMNTDGDWELKFTLSGHEDWVKDVSWSSFYQDPTIASCSQDGVVYIWKKKNDNEDWEKKALPLTNKEIVWRVTWANTGILAVSSGDNNNTFWREVNGEWENFSF